MVALPAEKPANNTVSMPAPRPSVEADEDGVRLFFPSDTHGYDLAAMGFHFSRLHQKYPNVTLDYLEAVEGGVQFDFLPRPVE